MLPMKSRLENMLLAALPTSERDEVLRRAQQMDFSQRSTFYAPETAISYVFFLHSGMASELIPVADGRAVDAAPVGCEGMVGIARLFATGANHHHSLMQIPGSGLRVPAVDVCQAFENCLHFRRLMLRYAYARFIQASQATACNLLHSIEQRLARWFLAAEFHTHERTFSITQEFLSEMLGANRSTVSLTLGTFERSGLVSYRRGVVQIEDAEKLAAAACECNQFINRAFEQVHQ